MKGLLRISTIVLVCLAIFSQEANAQRSKESDEGREQDTKANHNRNIPESPRRSGSRAQGGRCSCRDLEADIENLELRLDNMVETWNDFVDKNRHNDDLSPVRRPHLGGRGSYSQRPMFPGAGRSTGPRFIGRSGMDDLDDRQGGQARQFRF